MKDQRVMQLAVKGLLTGDNPRQEIDEGSLAELMASMKHNGLLQPIGVRKVGQGFKVLYGHRRLMAAQRLGWNTVDAIEISVADDNDALLKTSTENVIRENVSMPEQGRIFYQLTKKGLNVDQITARMGVKKSFVLAAISAFKTIPKKYHDKITFGTRGSRKEDGTIPATVALTAIDIKKEHTLSDQQVGALMDWAARHRVNVHKMRSIGRMMASEGTSVKESIEAVEYIRAISIQVAMKISVINRLQAETKMKIHDILYTILSDHKELGLKSRRDARMKDRTPAFVNKFKVRKRQK